MALNHLNFVQQLYDIAPGYRSDKDEDWTCHLALDEQRLVRDRRAVFIDRVETFKEFVNDCNYETGLIADRAARKRKEAEFKREITKQELALQNEAKNLIGRLSELKKKAVEIKKRKFKETHEEVARRAKDSAIHLSSDSETEEEDEYLPTKRRLVEPPPQPKLQAPNRPLVAAPEPPTPPPTKSAEAELIKNLDARDAEIVIHLKHGIIMYGAIDRFRSALLAYRETEQILMAIQVLDETLTKHKLEMAANPDNDDQKV